MTERAVPDALSKSGLIVGAVGGGLVALAGRFQEATPCCGFGRTLLELFGSLILLFLVGFAVVHAVRALVSLFRGRWRQMLIRVGSVAAIPFFFFILRVPVVFDPDYWWLRTRGGQLEGELLAKAASEPALAVIMGRDITRGLFMLAAYETKEIIYDASDEISEPAALRSEAWKTRAERAFKGRCWSGAKEIRGVRMFGHFFVVYDSCSQGV